MVSICSLNVKSMRNAMLSCRSQVELDDLWNSFLTLRGHGFISYETWDRFYDTCSCLYFDDDFGCVTSSH